MEMEKVLLQERFKRLQVEFNKKLYVYFTSQRNLETLKEDLNRIESGLAELEGLLNEIGQAEKAKQEVALAKKAPNTKGAK